MWRAHLPPVSVQVLNLIVQVHWDNKRHSILYYSILTGFVWLTHTARKNRCVRKLFIFPLNCNVLLTGAVGISTSNPITPPWHRVQEKQWWRKNEWMSMMMMVMVMEPVFPPSGITAGLSRQVMGDKSVKQNCSPSPQHQRLLSCLLLKISSGWIYTRATSGPRVLHPLFRHLLYSLKGGWLVLESMENSDGLGQKCLLGKV